MRPSIRFKRDATAGFGRPCYRVSEVISDAPVRFMQSMVHNGIAEWVVSPEQVESHKREMAERQLTKMRSTEKALQGKVGQEEKVDIEEKPKKRRKRKTSKSNDE